MTKKKIWIPCVIAVIAIILILAFVMTHKKKPKPAPEPASTEQTKEDLEYTGILVDAQVYTLTVEGKNEALIFDISNANFEYKEERGGIQIGDTVTVTYSEEKDGSRTAKVVTVIKETEAEIETFKGIVSDLDEKEVEVTSEQFTVRFDMDDETNVEGKLSKGDEVEITYQNEFNAVPYAAKIKVLSENEDKEKAVCMGQISEIKDDRFYVSIQSAHGYYFKLTKDTVITGKAKELKVGQQVSVTYIGHPENTPDAISVKVEKDVEEETYKLSGIVSDVTEKKLVVRTDDDIATFILNDKTKYSGEEAAKDLNVTVMYTGSLDSEAIAVSVYCVNPKPEPTPDPPKPDPTPDPPKPDPEPTPEPEVIVKATGVVTEWGDTCKILTDTNNTIELTVEEDLDMPVGYNPEKNDIVHFEYDMKSMKLKKMVLCTRPDRMSTGTILSWKDGKATLSDIKGLKNGKEDLTEEETKALLEEHKNKKAEEKENEIEFVIDDNLEIPAGYMPQEGDIVKFKYEEENGNNRLTFIAFLAAPEK